MGLIWTTLGVVPLVLGAWWTARTWLKNPTGAPCWLSAFLLGWVWVTLGMLILGHLGLISPAPLVAWSFAALGIGLAGRLRSRPGASLSDDLIEREPLGCDLVVALGLSGWVVLWMGVQSLILPVKVVSDGPIYHLYFAARWWQEGRIFLVATPFGETAAPYFSHVGELAMTWLFTLWGGDRLAKLTQFPFWLVTIATAYASARELGSGRSAAMVASLIFATSTPYVLFAFEPNVDAIFVAGFLLSCYFALRFSRQGQRRTDLVLTALAAGAAWGTKPTGIVFVPPLLLLVAIIIVLGREPIRTKLANLLILGLGVLVMEGYWLARNGLLTGNPLYPLHLERFGVVLLDGWYGPDAMPRSKYYLPFRDFAAFGDLLLAVVDPRLAPLWMAALITAILPWGDQGSRRARRLFAVGCLVNVLLFWVVIPYRTQQRFLFQAFGLGVVPLAFLLDRSKLIRWLAFALLALHLLSPQGWPWMTLPWDLSPMVPNNSPPPAPFLIRLADLSGPRWIWGVVGSLVGLACFATASCLVMAWKRRSQRWLAIAGMIAVVQVAVQSQVIWPEANAAVLRRFPPFRDYLPAWVQLDLRTQREPARVAYAGTNIPIYLMGNDYRNTVRYVNVDAHRDWLLHDYHRVARSQGQPAPWPDTRPLWDRLQPDYDAWLANLRAERIRYLVVARANPAEGELVIADREGFPIERVWADAHPEVFAPVYGITEQDPQMKIYALRADR